MESKTITREYRNSNNGGRERVSRNGDAYAINSDWGKGFSADSTPVSRTAMIACLKFTGAPQAVVDAILSE